MNTTRVGQIQEVRELQTALGLVAAEAGICIIPYAARLLRADLHYRLIDHERATSPIILSHRVNDHSQHIVLIKRLLGELYAEPAPWLDNSANGSPEPSPHPQHELDTTLKPHRRTRKA